MSHLAAQFAGKVALITGAGTGMGADAAILLAQRGAKVVLVGRRPDPLSKVQKHIEDAGGEALAIPADVSSAADMERVVGEAMAKFGALHYAVNNAGVSSESHDLPDLPPAVWEDTIAINLSSVYYCMKAQLPAIANSGGGSIVNVSSVFADRGFPERAAYSTSKHGLRGLTRSTAIDWAARNIRVNELQPGVIETPMTTGSPEETAAVIARSIPANRVGQGREIATAAAFLLSDEASYVTGAHLAVDGGFLA
ncbi:3-oxoacyl-reductase [Ilyonectria destructans]|nr:3-oxoacyl-reductase [Ilyonectria destructans]